MLHSKSESPLAEVTCLNGLNSRISQSTRWQGDIYPNPTESRHIWTLLWSCLLLMFTFHWPIFHPAHGKQVTYRSWDEVTVSARFLRRSATAAHGGHALLTTVHPHACCQHLTMSHFHISDYSAWNWLLGGCLQVLF